MEYEEFEIDRMQKCTQGHLHPLKCILLFARKSSM